MDISSLNRENRVGSKFGGGGVAGASESNVDRRERLRKLALETIDLAKDPYILRNHLGSLECRLCLTLHTNEGSYLAHTQGKKHQTNLARRAARDAKETQLMVAPSAQSSVQRKVFLKIGRPGYRVTKVRDNDTGKEGMMVQVHLPQVKEGVMPRRRFMSAWEQKREPPNKAYQYLIVAAEPYETIAFRIPAREIEDESEDAGYWNWSHWDPDTKQYSFQFMFRLQY
ncbi:splicing factor 3a [Coprinopsis sp. MPI-PUGE-AT-0042]|nr:splicing factor 3a [Coprinopsis sp. MPI-PUGE-AT-0042]